ncbi:hypothetical protein [Sphingomonas sp. LY160]|uniref:hypothetical protein n=1 Tax=Sphingomonas sp. LY160 TaxID=3095342 RepID=UPI002ADEC116|nr:hypothetical protein [Sphingomonas sp. LY160]MEA1071084.1 hypothetical protein [Sphingomonas sp. LY160]
MSKAQRRNRPNAKGRNPTSRFVRLDHRLLTSPAYRSLSTNARSLLVELTMLHNGENNGSLYLSVGDAAARIGVADPHTAGRAFDELEARDFIAMTKEAHFQVKASQHSRARTWRLNWEPGPGRRIAAWDFLYKEPAPQTQERKRMERGCRALKAYQKRRDREQFPAVEIPHDPRATA